MHGAPLDSFLLGFHCEADVGSDSDETVVDDVWERDRHVYKYTTTAFLLFPNRIIVVHKHPATA
jgi:hypothetical protein